MKKTITLFCILFTTLTVVAQSRSINANFEEDKQGWTSHQGVEWSHLFGSMADRKGLSFSGENMDGKLFLFVQKEISDLLPNRNYRVTFNMNWLAWLEASASPIIVKVGANDNFIVAGRLTPNENGYPFLQNVNNFDNAFFVNTDEKGRLFLMIGIETENEKIEHVYLNTLRVLLHENGEAREKQTTESTPLSTENIMSDEEEEEDPAVPYYEEGRAFSPVIPDMIDEMPSGIKFISNVENDLVFFESDFNDEVEMVGIYTEDNHLMKIFTFRDSSVDRAFQTTGLVPGTYRIEFVLADGRIINETYTIK